MTNYGIIAKILKRVVVVLEYELSKTDLKELQDYLASIKKYPKLIYREYDELLKNPTSENQQKVILGSLIMTANYATKVYKQFKQYFVFPYSILDFIQTGNEALIKIVYEKKYDNYKNFIWAFHRSLRQNIIKNYLPISWNIVDKYFTFLNQRDEFLKEYQHEASNQEMMEKYGYGKKGIGYMNNYLNQNQVLKRALNDDLVTDGFDYIPELVHYLNVRNTILEILKELNLPPHYYEILIRYFGLTTEEYDGDNIMMMPIEINETYKFNNCQRIHQIIKITIDKIRNNKQAMKKLIKCKEITF